MRVAPALAECSALADNGFAAARKGRAGPAITRDHVCALVRALPLGYRLGGRALDPTRGLGGGCREAHQERLMASRTKATAPNEGVPETEAPGTPPDSPLLDLVDAAVKKLIRGARK